jgi:hypothetical protein
VQEKATRPEGEERGVVSDVVTGAATTAGGLAVIKGSQVLGKIVDKVKPKN